MSNIDLRKTADQMINAAIKAVDPYALINEQIRRDRNILTISEDLQINLDEFNRIFVCGAGKGAAPMARAMEELLQDDITGGDVIVKYKHLDRINYLRIHEAGHPLPDKNSLKSTNILLKNLSDLKENDLVFVLLTGGGSALLESLPHTISLKDMQKLSSILLGCSATIHEINCIRKHISRIKGGQLARTIYPAQCITLALSDVIGDDLSVIASGPTSPDPSTFNDASTILDKYQIKETIPRSIGNYLDEGLKGVNEETPKHDDKIFDKVVNLVIGNNRLALLKAGDIARDAGYNTLILTSMIEGEAREIAAMISAIIKEIQSTDMPLARPACIMMGGEPTVNLRGKGKGGRNQELALAIALRNIQAPYLFVSCGSDGTDGPTDAAGALVDEMTMPRAARKGINGEKCLQENDAYHFFAPLMDLIKTGPTGTNVMDVIFALIPE